MHVDEAPGLASVLVAACALVLTASPAFGQATSAEARALFEKPPASFRPAPFWAWNEELDDGEIRRQAAGFEEQGFGGYFIHARAGLKTRYLSERWFDRVKAAVDAASRLGLATWIYDDERWPSGSAGGLATHGAPAFRGVGLGFSEVPAAEVADSLADPATLAVFAVRENAVRILSRGDQLPGETVLRFFVRPFAPDNWYNGEAYLDVLNPEAVRHFLDLTFSNGYDRRFAARYGKEIAGAFTDEPNFLPQRGRDGTSFPWTPGFLEIFARTRGYELLPRMPLLVRPLPGFERVRYDFWRTVTEQFEAAYSRPYGARMRELGLTSTGHFLGEESLSGQTAVAGSVMLHYLHQQMPGVDQLRLALGSSVTKKQASSIAHQFGRERVLAEIWGSSGHSATFEELKWVADSHFAHGINFLCPHLSLYSMAGPRKRDFPPTFSEHEPFWPYLRTLNDYLARAAVFTTRGLPANDILLLVPLGSVWERWTPERATEEVRFIERSFEATVDRLLESHRDFDLGDELIIERTARVEAGVLRVGPEGRYRTVILPPATRWSSAFVELLARLLEAGGTVIATDPQPESIIALARTHGFVSAGAGLAGLEGALSTTTQRALSIVDRNGNEIPDIVSLHRSDGNERHYFFVVNRNRELGHHLRLNPAHAGYLERWDLDTGSVRPLESLTVELPPAGSLAFTIDSSRPALPPAGERPARHERIVSSNGPFEFRRLHPSVLVLDRCRYSISNGPELGPSLVQRVRDSTHEAAGLKPYEELQPWAFDWRRVSALKPVPLLMRFEVESELDGPTVSLVVESAGSFRATVNGVPVHASTKSLWDRAFGLFVLDGRLRRGTNRIELETVFRPGIEIENVLLVGDFATRRLSDTRYALVQEPASLSSADWTTQGYHFYAGNMAYRVPVARRSGESVSLRLEKPTGSLFAFSVSGREVARLGWRPWQVDLTEALGPGVQSVEVTVVSSLQNAFGALHSDQYQRPRSKWSSSPKVFLDTSRSGGSYFHAPHGIGPVTIVYSRRSEATSPSARIGLSPPIRR